MITIELFQGEPIEAVGISSDPLNMYMLIVQLPNGDLMELYYSRIKHIS